MSLLALDLICPLIHDLQWTISLLKVWILLYKDTNKMTNFYSTVNEQIFLFSVCVCVWVANHLGCCHCLIMKNLSALNETESWFTYAQVMFGWESDGIVNYIRQFEKFQFWHFADLIGVIRNLFQQNLHLQHKMRFILNSWILDFLLELYLFII